MLGNFGVRAMKGIAQMMERHCIIIICLKASKEK